MLILICGLPATGKSTVARRLAKLTRAELLRTDAIRKRIILKPSYSKKEKNTVYRTVFLLADYLIKNGVDVIIDGTFYTESLRREAQEIAKRRGARFFLVETSCPEKLVLERLKRRKRSLRSLSDADLEVYYKIKKIFEPITEEHITVETAWDIKKAVNEAYEQIRA